MLPEKKCPNCGKEMMMGHVTAGIKHYIVWTPKGKRPSGGKELAQGWPFWKKGTPEEGMLLHPPVDGLTTGVCYLPALLCNDCQMVIVDYDPDHALLKDEL